MKKLIAPISLAMAVAVSGIVNAADEVNNNFEEVPSGVAVSDVNAKVELGIVHFDFGSQNNPAPGFFNFWDTSTAFVAEGAVSMPLTNQFGLQIDFGYLGGDIDLTGGGGSGDITGLGVGAHLFWRDSTVGLLGLYGHFVDYDVDGIPLGVSSFENTRLMVEGEKYMGNFTYKGGIGFDNLDTNVFGDEDFLNANAEINYYHTDNLMFRAGVNHSFEQTTGVIGVEAMYDNGNNSPSLFVEASFGDDVTAIAGGVKFYLGKQQKSLIARHREDDPFIGLFDSLGLIGKCLGISAGGRRMIPTDNEISAASEGSLVKQGGDSMYDNEIRFGRPPKLNGCEVDVNTRRMPEDF